MLKILTVIVPSYNMEAYLPKCLGSMVVPPERMAHLEVIVVNDGSMDGTGAVAREFAAKWPETFRVVDKPNGNYGSCVNRGLAEATGAYVKVLDADDFVDSAAFVRYLDAVDEEALRGESAADLILTDYAKVDASGRAFEQSKFGFAPGHSTLDAKPERSDWIAVQAVAYRTDNVRRMGYRQLEGVSYTDLQWVLEPMTTVRRLRYLPETVTYYRIGRAGQTMDPQTYARNYGQVIGVVRNIATHHAALLQAATAESRAFYHREVLRLLGDVYSRVLVDPDMKRFIGELERLDDAVKDDADLYVESDGIRLKSRILPLRHIRAWRRRRTYHAPQLAAFRLYRRTLDVLPMGLWVLLFVADRLSSYGKIEINLNGYLMFALVTALWTGLLMIPRLTMGRAARWFYAPAFAVCALSCMVQWYVRTQFGMVLDGSLVGIVLASSPNEMRAFLCETLTPTAVAGIVAALLFAAWAARVFWRQRCAPVRGRGVALALAFLAAFVAWHPVVLSSPAKVLSFRPMTNLWYDLVARRGYFEQLHALRETPSLPSGLRLDVRADDAPFVVFVLGESSTRNRWSAYGYGRETTPRIDAVRDETVVFTDVVGALHYTEGAMRMLFTEADSSKPWEMNCTLPQLLRCAGYRTVLVTAQERWDNYGGSESYMFAGCDKMVYLGEEGLSEPWYDSALLPYLDREIAGADSRPTAVFLHLNGSHNPIRDRCPPEKRRFEPEVYPHNSGSMSPAKNRNHYDNTIAFTDEILGGVIDRLRRLPRSTVMFYVSDHGESVDSDHWRNLADRSIWELPMVCWLSPRFRANYPETVRELEAAKDRPLQTDRLLAGLVSLFRVKGYGRAEDDFHNARFELRRRMIRNGTEEYAGR